MKKIVELLVHYQTLYVVWGNMFLFLILLMLLPWNWWLPVFFIISYFTISAISEITIHRYFCHKSYEVSNTMEKILLFLTLFVGQGSIIHWVAVHRQHHAFEDTPNDPHSPFFVPVWKLFLGLFPKIDYKPALVADLLRCKNRKYIIFEKKYYMILWTLIWIFSFFISPWTMFFIVSGSTLWFLGTSLVNIKGHKSNNEKRFPNAVGFNSSWLNLITGAGHHNNHHATPYSHTYKKDNEIDVYGSIIKLYATKLKTTERNI